MDLDQSRACDGEFEEVYQPLKAVGKGAFGFVWKAIRRCDGLEVRKPFTFIQKAILLVYIQYTATVFICESISTDFGK